MDVIPDPETTAHTSIAEDLQLASWIEERNRLMTRVDWLEGLIFKRTSFLQRGVKD